VTRLATHPQETILEPPALQVLFELPLHMPRQRTPGGAELRNKVRVVALDEKIQKTLSGPVAVLNRQPRGPSIVVSALNTWSAFAPMPTRWRISDMMKLLCV
jgi:hypothetical protein